MEKEICEIKIRIHEESDLYNPLDPESTLLSDDVISYVERKYREESELGDRLVIHIVSDTPVDEERIHRNFHNYIQTEITVLAKEQRRTALKQVWLFIIGALFITVWLIVAANTENLFVEVLSIIGSFALWEAANIWIVETPEMRLKKRMLKRLDETEIRVSSI